MYRSCPLHRVCLSTAYAIALGTLASTQEVSGPNGGIQGITTTAPLADLTGGSPSTAALLDGNVSGSAGSYVEWYPAHRFTYELESVSEVDEFHLWNDRGQVDSGIGHFTLRFWSAAGTFVGDLYSDEASLPAFSDDPSAEVFTFPTYAGVKSVELAVWTEVTNEPSCQFREVAFGNANGGLLDGPNGGIESVTSTVTTWDTSFGGAVTPAATIDGDVSGGPDSYVQWDLVESTFTFDLANDYDLTGFELWNDRGQVDAWAIDLRFVFLDGNGDEVGSLLELTASAPPSEDDPDPEVLPFDTTRANVESVVLTVLNGVSSTVQIREMAFLAECGPAPAAEVVRAGVPANPVAFLPGQTMAPFIGETWDPWIDHNLFVPAATLDFLLLSPAPINASIGFPGTLLCNLAPWLLFLDNPSPGTPFQVPIPDSCELIGLEICAQGGSLDQSFFMHLANALDLVIGKL